MRVDQIVDDDGRKTDRTGGMATKGTAEDPHLVDLSGDGAGLSDANSGVRLVVFPSQSPTYCGLGSTASREEARKGASMARRRAEGGWGAGQLKIYSRVRFDECRI